jgi:hypothetical protein
MVILIPFLTQPPHERTLTGRGSRVYPNVGAAGCTLKVGAAGCTLTSGQLGVAWSGQEVCSGFALAARASPSQLPLAARCMNSYYTIRIKNCMNWYKNHTLYEFVLYNSYKKLYYTICITSFVWICKKISEKKICIRVGISTRDQYLRLKSSRSAIHHPTSSISAHFIYIPYNKITIRKSGLYDLTRVAYIVNPLYSRYEQNTTKIPQKSVVLHKVYTPYTYL